MISISDLPALNASFNLVSTIFISMGSSQTDRALDDPNLAIRLGHRRVCVFDALQMVSSGSVIQAILPARDRLRRQDCLRHVQSLAHGNDLMFDQPMRAAAHTRNVYGNYCDVQ